MPLQSGTSVFSARRLRGIVVARACERLGSDDPRTSMSDLIPNLDDLRNLLPPDETAPDAHAFLERLSEAATEDEAVAKVDALVDEWLTVPSE